MLYEEVIRDLERLVTTDESIEVKMDTPRPGRRSKLRISSVGFFFNKKSGFIKINFESRKELDLFRYIWMEHKKHAHRS